MTIRKLIFTTFAIAALGRANAQTPTAYTIDADNLKAHIQPNMYGIFFEDINLAADGGVYAELVKNRSFEFDSHLAGWAQHEKNGGRGSVEVIDRRAERPENAHTIKVNVTSNTGFFGLSNEGFRGMGIKKGEVYTFTVTTRKPAGNAVKLLVELHDAKGAIIGKGQVRPTSADWQKYSVKFTATATDSKASLYVWLQGKGSVDMDMVSLFPQHTWKNRPGGLRADLVQKLADMKPGFLRFPGGCIVEGRDLQNRYQWKKSIGDIDQRENIINRWNTEFSERLTPDYYQTFGLGFMEYFMTAEDIGASPLPILNCGMACQFNTGQLVPLNELDPYVQDALDLIEFANGGPETQWGALRARLGHPKPFNLKMMGVGNEQWGEQYIQRWKIFTKAIKDKYPYIKIISSVGPYAEGEEFNRLDKFFRSNNADILDEHYYKAPKWFLANAARYDNYDRNGPRIFAGEYAAHSTLTTDALKKNNWESALAEAAFMTGLERNADIVIMASYAPLFAHVDGWQWAPDLIWYDNLRAYSTPSYYVQQLFSLNKGTDAVPLLKDGLAVSGKDGAYATASVDKNTRELIIKFVNVTDTAKSLTFNISSGATFQKTASVITLGNYAKDAVNSLDKPKNISPVNSTMAISGKVLNTTIEPNTFKIIRLKML
ncbi:alpha-L-arabinofuranosidase C-terminal domain-containing protein [Mucilaginibacter psychrotolerans]|uniref:non-reducing end alpha-L-arabinofuranosidase n=1 Tax=Mucilaginibacter psychrotolerans TaxID=1524096 RepID=A0A4Y8S4M1_9SPHI|nr:alpha-L-arabinofuranosidase C-terminal domain-containing protein [Mucilaginibacter psychrotolerans]TFF33374.1 alpha-L-arabinofuranosidase [Mucilaginibacter psychrotolerans]